MGATIVARSASAQAQQLCEDAVLEVGHLDEGRAGGAPALWAVFDGHGGRSVSQFLAQELATELMRRMPTPPADQEWAAAAQHAAGSAGTAGDAAPPPTQLYVYADGVRRAVAATFLSLALRVQQQQQRGGERQGPALAALSSLGSGAGVSGAPGSTATVVVQTGGLLTVANVGHTHAALDTGSSVIELTADHTLGNDEDEEERLDAAGARVARLRFDLSGPARPGEVGCGPLRLWPGGLLLSRSIGDAGCGSGLVLPHPHITQLWLPRRASRLLVATEGVWSAFDSAKKPVGLLRGVALEDAPAALLRRSQQRRQHLHGRTDMSVLVVDFAEQGQADFRSQVRLDRLSCSSAGSGQGGGLGASGAPAGSLLRRSQSPRPPGNLTVAGMRQLPRPQQAACLRRHSHTGALPPPSIACGSGRRASCKGISGPGGGLHQQQQQQQQQQRAPIATVLLQRLLCASCLHPLTDGDEPVAPCGGNHQLQQVGGRVLQPLTSFGSSASDNSHTATATTLSASTCGTHSSQAMGCSSGGSTPSGSWRARRWRACSRKPPAGAQQERSGEGASFARIICRCDTFLALFGGQHHPLHLQLAALEGASGSGAAAMRATRSLNDLRRSSSGGTAPSDAGAGVLSLPLSAA